MRLAGDEADLAAGQLVAEEGERQAGKVAAASHASHHDVRIVLGQLHLFFRLQADDGLVQQDVVQHAAQRVAHTFLRDRRFHCLADRDTQAARAFRVLFQDRLAALRFHGRTRRDLATPKVHHHPPIGLLVVAHLDHEDLTLHVEHLAGERQRGPPLARSGLRRQPLDAFHLVVVGLGNRGVGLVTARRTVALVLEVNPGGCAQGLLQPPGTHQRRGPPDGIDLTDFLGDGHPSLAAHLLLKQPPCEDSRELGWIHGLVRRRIQRWGWQLR